MAGTNAVDAGIVLHASSAHRRSTSGRQGGSVDLTTQIILSHILVPTEISFRSSSSADIEQVYLIEGVGITGLVETESVQLNGLSSVRSIRQFVKLLRVIKQSGSPLVGNVTISNSQTLSRSK